MEKIFALDIGTRKVAGLIAQKQDHKLNIIDCEIREHQTRAMLAGQIHDIERVADTVEQIRQALETRSGEKLERVAIAVAGRTLKTIRGVGKKPVSPEIEINKQEIIDLELAAVQEVLNNLHQYPDRDIATDFYCVGYSVVSYTLDGQKIDNLIGQKGEEIKAEVLATFLPRIVLESMFTVLKRVGLEISSLTLEPIAAIEIIIPQDMRRLNLALVDIGAGTSDIAITSGGSVVAYGMVTMAGDEVTDRLCEHYLLDFYMGERVKRQLNTQEKVQFVDIFGKHWELYSQQIVTELSGDIQNLAQNIVDKIFELNQKSPHAVVCVGGGSRTPILQEKIAQALSLSKERVGIRGPEMITFVNDSTGKLTGPEAVTPLGIASIAEQKQGLQFVNVTVNGTRVHLLNINKNLNILTALMAAGCSAKKLHGKPGLAKTYELNGQIQVIKGTLPRAAVIKINDQLGVLEQPIKDNDIIIFEEARDGEDGRAKIKDILQAAEIKVTLNGRQRSLWPLVYMNRELVSCECEIEDLAKLEVKPEFSLREVLRQEGYDVTQTSERTIMVTINDDPRILVQQSYRVLINGQEASLEAVVKNENVIEYIPYQPRHYQIKDVIPLPATGRNVTFKVNGQQFSIEGSKGKISMNGQEVTSSEFVINGAEIRTFPGQDAQPILVDIFRYFSLTLDQESGRKLRLLVDGQEATFMSHLHEGSEVQIFFE